MKKYKERVVNIVCGCDTHKERKREKNKIERKIKKVRLICTNYHKNETRRKGKKQNEQRQIGKAKGRGEEERGRGS